MNWIDETFRFNLYERNKWVSAQAAKIPPGSKVLDVAAGTGPYRSLFDHCEYRTHDFGKEPGTIGKYTELDYNSDILNIPVQNSSFDVILCTEVLEHVPEPIAGIREMARILKTGGKIIITAPLGSFLHQEPYHFYGGFTPEWYKKFLSDAGFRVEIVEKNRGYFSWYGQESVRLGKLLNPVYTLRKMIWWRWLLITFLWLAILPVALFFPIFAKQLDSLKLENLATVGYHVVAIKEA